MPEGKADVVGVAGRTLTDEWGDRVDLRLIAEELTEFEFEEVDDAFERVWAWWILRIEDTDDEVDLRPRRPADERR